MPYERPTLTTVVTRIMDDIKSRIENANSILRRSMLKILSRVLGGAVHLLYGFINFLSDQMFMTSADEEYLVTHCEEYGIQRKAAVKATGEGTATGTNGYIISVGALLQTPDGTEYSVDKDVLISGGIANLSSTAVIAGVDGNQDPGTVLTFVSPITGVDTTVTVDSNGITGGLDQEDVEDLRDRGLTRKRQPPHGGADFDYVSWALEYPGVTRAWSFPQYQGVGTIGLAFVRDNDENTILPDSDQRQAVRNYIVSHTNPLTGLVVGCPVGAEPGLYVIDLGLHSLDFTLAIYPKTTAVQNLVQAKLQEMIVDLLGPGETNYKSDIIKYASRATGLVAVRVESPEEDTAIAVNRVPVMGTIQFKDY
jgi:uncharacterized phage protein gp47/JayE